MLSGFDSNNYICRGCRISSSAEFVVRASLMRCIRPGRRTQSLRLPLTSRRSIDSIVRSNPSHAQRLIDRSIQAGGATDAATDVGDDVTSAVAPHLQPSQPPPPRFNMRGLHVVASTALLVLLGLCCCCTRAAEFNGFDDITGCVWRSGNLNDRGSRAGPCVHTTPSRDKEDATKQNQTPDHRPHQHHTPHTIHQHIIARSSSATRPPRTVPHS